jgi:predicted dithiol-disulfide oxidoreductase (DUF899 family)
MSISMKTSPRVVDEDEWRTAHQALLAKEKALTHARDELAAERRRLPMVRVKNYSFEGTRGPVTLLELFDGRSQLLLYHFMFAPGVHGWPTAGCPGCSMFIDNIGQFTRVHLKARGASFAAVSRAPLPTLEAYRRRMEWEMRWVSSADNSFNEDFDVTTEQSEQHGLSAFFRREDEIFRTYFTTARGLETVGGIWSFLDLTPFGRQEQWEGSPSGWPQSPPYQWWHRHDEYPS